MARSSRSNRFIDVQDTGCQAAIVTSVAEGDRCRNASAT